MYKIFSQIWVGYIYFIPFVSISCILTHVYIVDTPTGWKPQKD